MNRLKRALTRKASAPILSGNEAAGCSPWPHSSSRGNDATNSGAPCRNSRLLYKGPHPLRTSDICRVLDISSNYKDTIDCHFGEFQDSGEEETNFDDKLSPYTLPHDILDGFPKPPSTLPPATYHRKPCSVSTGDLRKSAAHKSPTRPMTSYESSTPFIHRQPLQRNHSATNTVRPLHVRTKASSVSLGSPKSRMSQNSYLPDARISSNSAQHLLPETGRSVQDLRGSSEEVLTPQSPLPALAVSLEPPIPECPNNRAGRYPCNYVRNRFVSTPTPAPNIQRSHSQPFSNDVLKYKRGINGGYF